MKSIKSILSEICKGIRFDKCLKNKWEIWCKSESESLNVLASIQALKIIDEGIEGHEFMRGLGLVHHVFVLKCGKDIIRILGPSFNPNGQFSNLSALERELVL